MTLTFRTQKSEFTFYDYRSFYIDTPLLGSCFARVEPRESGTSWHGLWWGDDERTGYNLVIGKWWISHDLPRWLVSKRYALAAENAAKRRDDTDRLAGYLAD